MTRKQIILIILFSLFVVLVGWLLFFVFFSGNVGPQQQRPLPSVGVTSTQPSTQFPSVGTGDPRDGGETGIERDPDSFPISDDIAIEALNTRQDRITNTPVQSVDASATNGSLRFYNEQDGRFYRLDANGDIEVLSDQVFFQADTVSWSPTNDEAIIEYPDGANIMYNFETKQQVTLPTHWEDFSFAPQGDQITAKSVALAPENRWVITSDPDGQNVTFVEPMGLNSDLVDLDWSPNKQIIGTSKTGQALGADRQEILMIGQYGENFKSIVVEGRGFQSDWSPTGDKLLYSVHSTRNGFRPELWIVDASGDNIGNNRTLLNVQTWAEKCTFGDDRFVYCGVPLSLQEGAGFAPAVADATPDIIYRIDTNTGLRTEIQTDQSYVVESMTVSPDGNTLYITDKQSRGLFAISI